MKLILFAILFSSSVHALELKFQYSPDLDKNCQAGEVSKESLLEVTKKLPELQESWKSDSTDFLKTIESLTGKKFKSHKIVASTFICFAPSTSIPLKLWVGPYLKSYQGKQRSKRFFSRLVLHEILHIFSFENLRGSSLLFKKYANEPKVARNHMHVMAMQKAIYLKLGLIDELNEHMKHEMAFGGGYARAWQIVNDIEGYRPFLEELARPQDNM